MTTLQKQPLFQLPQKRTVPRQLTQVITLEPRELKRVQLSALELAAFSPQERPQPEPLPSLPAKQTYAVKRAEGYISRLGGQNLKDGKRLEIELPFGTPRKVNVATLKRLLGGSPTDTLLKKTGSTWIICDNAMPVDLLNRRVQFRLGQVAVLS